MAMLSAPSRAPRFSSRWWTVLATLFVIAGASFSCGGGGGGGGGGDTPSAGPPAFSGGGTGTEPAGTVYMTGANVDSDEVDVQVKLVGPVNDVSAFIFDIVLSNPSVMSLTNVAVGDVFSPGTGSALASIQGSRVVVGVTKTGTPGTNVAAGSSTVVTLRFRMSGRGTCALSFAASAGATDPVIQNSTGQTIGGITFSNTPASSVSRS